MANARHYPSIHWLHSYSDYVEDVSPSWEKLAPDWGELRTEALTLLQREERLQQIVKLVGPDVLPESQRLILLTAELLKDGFLTQSAYDEADMSCSPERQVALLRIILDFHRRGEERIQKGVPLASLKALPSLPRILRAKSDLGQEALAQLEQRLREELDGLGAGGPP